MDVPIQELKAPDALIARIRALTPSLPPAAARVTEVLLADPGAAARQTIDDLARAAGTSVGTVTRTVRTLGFSGYADFRLTLAEVISGHQTEQPAVTGDVMPDDSAEDLIAKAAAIETRTLRETASHLESEVLGHAANALVGARKISMYGASSSGLAPQDLHVKFQRIGLMSQFTSDPHQAIANAALLEHEDVALVASHSGRSWDAVEFLKVAADTGAATIAITGTAHSALANAASYTLIASGTEDAFRSGSLSSRIGDIFIAHCLFIAVTQRMLDSASKALEHSHIPLSARLDTQPAPRRRNNNRGFGHAGHNTETMGS